MWLIPVLERLFAHLHQRLTTGWDHTLETSGQLAAVAASMGANTREDTEAANEEIIDDRLLRELTTEYFILLRTTQETSEGIDSKHPKACGQCKTQRFQLKNRGGAFASLYTSFGVSIGESSNESFPP